LLCLSLDLNGRLLELLFGESWGDPEATRASVAVSMGAPWAPESPALHDLESRELRVAAFTRPDVGIDIADIEVPTAGH
jgi:hypothetical protein